MLHLVFPVSYQTLSLLLEVVSSAHAWPGSTCLLRETGLLDQLLRLHAGEKAVEAAEPVASTIAATAREVLVGLALRDLGAAKRVRNEMAAKVGEEEPPPPPQQNQASYFRDMTSWEETKGRHSPFCTLYCVACRFSCSV